LATPTSVKKLVGVGDYLGRRSSPVWGRGRVSRRKGRSFQTSKELKKDLTDGLVEGLVRGRSEGHFQEVAPSYAQKNLRN